MNEDLTKAWGFTEDTVSEESSSKFLSAGIHEEVFITKLAYESTPESNYLLVEMADANGKVVNRRYFEPKIDGQIVKTDDDLKKAVNTTVKIIANLARKFKGEDYVCSGTSFADLCRNVINDIGEYKNKPLRTKVLLNKKNFPVLPAYAPIWEDPKVISTANSKLTINSIDKVKPTTENADTDTPKSTGGPSWLG